MKADALAARIQRMADVANLRLADAAKLGRDALRESDSDYLLRLLAFEILLKALVRINNGSPGRNHSYQRLFQSLPDEVKARVVLSATQRMSTSADYSSMAKLLDRFSKNFIALRYPYEAYESLSADGYRAAGESWVAKGAPLSEAVFVYYPEELLGLTLAVQAEVQHWLAAVAE
jgi:HEPN domain-containing protein